LAAAFNAARDAFWNAATPPRGVALSDQGQLRPQNLSIFRAAARRADEFLQLVPGPRARRIEIKDAGYFGNIKTFTVETLPPFLGPASPDWRVPTVLYYSAIAHSWLEEHGLALAALDRLLEEYPDYQRPQVPGFPQFKRPTDFELLHLKLYHLSRLSPLQPVPAYVAPYLKSDNVLQTLQNAVNAATLSLQSNKSGISSLRPVPQMACAATK